MATRTEYDEIDDARQNSAMAGMTRWKWRRTVRAVLTDAHRYAPPVLAAVGSTLFDHRQHAHCAFWFYAGQLRAWIEAELCPRPRSPRAMY